MLRLRAELVRAIEQHLPGVLIAEKVVRCCNPSPTSLDVNLADKFGLTELPADLQIPDLIAE